MNEVVSQLSENDNIGVKRITAGMSDTERYELLKDRIIDVPFFDAENLAKIDINDYNALERIGKSGAFKILRKIGEDFGVFKEGYTTQDVGVECRFSKRNLQESVHMHNQRWRFKNYAKMLTILNTVIENALGIEAHRERYDYPGSRLDVFFIFISAFCSNEYIIPVLLEIKTYTDETTASLYIALSLREIERSRILGHTQDTKGVKSYPSPTSISVSLSDLFANVNTADANLLKYVPDEFLSDTQKEAKRKAIKETVAYIDNKNRQQSHKTDRTADGDSFISEAFIDYERDENSILFILRRKLA